jgi:integrase
MRLSEAIEIYVERRRAEGFLLVTGTVSLHAFCKSVGDLPLVDIAAQDILHFLDGPRTSTGTWRSKYSLLRRFCEYWSLRGAMQLLLLPPPRPPAIQTFVPFIYTRSQIRLLLHATRMCQERGICVIDADTLRTFLLTLYATGALVSEILNLRVDDLSIMTSQLTIRDSRFVRSRRIPIGSDLRDELKTFMEFRTPGIPSDAPLFLCRGNLPLKGRVLNLAFRRLCRVAGVARREGATPKPRMHDLRATFAVHRITSWIRNGADLNRMLPALAAYMGNSGLASTEQYLALTPERFRKELQKLSPQCDQKRWRDDPALMRFLSTLETAARLR